MYGPKIFISYSHDDSEDLEQLRKWLKPLADRGMLEYWDDTRIEGGEEWSDKIDAALESASVAVLLVSQSFVASSFITDVEMPRIFAKADEGRLTVLPVFLKPFSDLEYTYRDAAGEEKRRKVTSFQGYGLPERPLVDRTWSDREKLYKKLAGRLETLSGGLAVPGLTSPRTSRAHAVVTEPAQEHVLTVELERRGSDLAARYFLPGSAAMLETSALWASVGERLEDIDRSIDEGVLPLRSGDVLFETLLGPEARWEKVLRAAFRRGAKGPRPNPTFDKLRVRIATDDSLLLRLPWRLTAWNGKSLAERGWSFSTTHVLDPTDDRTTTAPANVLVIAPRKNGHIQAVVELLRSVWPTDREPPDYVRAVGSRQAIKNAWRGMRPHAVYVHARGRVSNGRRSLSLDDGESLALNELVEIFRAVGHLPEMIYLNTTGLGRPDELCTEVPMVLWRRRSEWEDDSASLALAWMRRWLEQGENPAMALHAAARTLLGTSLEAATLGVHSTHRAWKTHVLRGLARERLVRLRLDRDHQKALVAKHLKEVARSDSRRAMALIAYAAPGNSIAELREQLRDYLIVEMADLAEIDWIGPLEWPPASGDLRRHLEDDLRVQLGAEADEPTAHLFRRHAPTSPGAGKKSVLWLDWGTFGDGHAAKLKPADLEAWLRFASEYLSFHCPDDLRIVAYLTIESQDSEHARLDDALRKHRREPWCRRQEFRLTVLPPLGEVAEEDLLDFLEDEANSSCPAPIQTEMAERLIAQTGGQFDETVALMEEAERTSWYHLLDRLRREQDGEPAEDDDEPF